MTLLDALDGQEYIIKQINTDDEELNAFLFSLGCYAGDRGIQGRLRGFHQGWPLNIDNQLSR